MGNEEVRNLLKEVFLEYHKATLKAEKRSEDMRELISKALDEFEKEHGEVTNFDIEVAITFLAKKLPFDTMCGVFERVKLARLLQVNF